MHRLKWLIFHGHPSFFLGGGIFVEKTLTFRVVSQCFSPPCGKFRQRNIYRFIDTAGIKILGTAAFFLGGEFWMLRIPMWSSRSCMIQCFLSFFSSVFLNKPYKNHWTLQQKRGVNDSVFFAGFFWILGAPWLTRWVRHLKKLRISGIFRKKCSKNCKGGELSQIQENDFCPVFTQKFGCHSLFEKVWLEILEKIA